MRGALFREAPCPRGDFGRLWLMALDVTDLRSFYASPLGETARRFVGAILNRRWDGVAGLSIVGLGYATPYLELFEGRPLAPAGDDARRTGRRELAALRAFGLGPDRRFDAAAARFLRRSHPARPCAGNRRTSARIAVGGLARTDAGRQADRRRPESLGPLGAARHDAVRPWPSLFAGAAARPDARNPVFADLLERGALYAALAARGLAASRARDRTGQRPAVAAGRGRAGRGGDQAALSAGRRPALATGLAGTRAGAGGGPDAAAFRLGTGGSRHREQAWAPTRAAADAGFIARRRAWRSAPWPSDRRSGRARV